VRIVIECVKCAKKFKHKNVLDSSVVIEKWNKIWKLQTNWKQSCVDLCVSTKKRTKEWWSEKNT